MENDEYRIPNGYFLIPVFLLIGLIIYRGNYIPPQSGPPHTVDSLQSYLGTYFWRTHGGIMGALLLLGAVFLPRTTMWWFAMSNPFGWVVSLGWWIAPRITLAFLMTTVYWHTNPELCVCVWVAAYVVASLKSDLVRKDLGEAGEDIIRGTFRGAFKVLAWLAVGGGILGVVYFALWLIEKLFVALVAGISNTNAIMGSIVSVFLCGLLLHIFRTVSRLWYGITEIIVALLLAGYTVSRTVKTPDETIASLDIFTTILALSSSIYIVVRGLDNIGNQNLKSLRIKLKKLISRITPKRLTKETSLAGNRATSG